MKIIILGAGQVGSSVAHSLAQENNDITVVDLNRNRLRELQDRLDLRVVLGFASHPRVLARAGAEDADMVIALTNSDETNMIACQVAFTLFHTPTKIARVRSTDYLDYADLFDREACPVDVLISPEQLVTQHVKRLIEYPGALQVLDFADGRAQLVAMRAYSNGPLVNHELRTLADHMPKGSDARIAAIFRGDTSIIPEGNTVIEEDDIVYFLAAKRDIRTVMSELQRLDRPIRKIILAGGGNIGRALAHKLEQNHYVKIIERDHEQARLISEELDRAIVLVGDCADEELLREENIDQTDVYCALTNDDEANILSSMLAKRMGASKVLTLINRPAYVDLVESKTIDIAISPQQITIGALLTHVRRGHVVRVHSLRRGAAEAIEAVAHGDKRNSRVVGLQIDEIALPPGTSIGGIIRGKSVIIPHHDTLIQSDDHVILFVLNKQHISDVEALFQVAVTFI